MLGGYGVTMTIINLNSVLVYQSDQSTAWQPNQNQHKHAYQKNDNEIMRQNIINIQNNYKGNMAQGKKRKAQIT